MLTCRQLLEHQIRLAFSGDPEMSIMGAVQGCGDEALGCRITPETWSIGEILYHVASCKIAYCKQASGKWQGETGQLPDTMEGIRRLLEASHEHLIECLLSLEEEALDEPLPLAFHGESAAHFFSVMVIHDVAHAAQIRATLRHCGVRTGGFYPVA